jgi:16S rRNA (cytidine1402-2'-O)-methyltransferase
MTTGRLFLVPLPLDFGCNEQAELGEVLPTGTLREAARLTHWVCENARTLRAFLKRVDTVVPLASPMQQIVIQELPRSLHKHGDPGNQAAQVSAMLEPARQGHDIGLASEAGMPAVADPGGSVVRAAHDLDIEVVPLIGPAALLLALAASGLNGQSFAFVGYLPQDPQARAQRLRALEQQALRSGQSQLFIETPYRNAALMDALVQVLQPQTRLSVSAGLTLGTARTRSATVARWRAQPWCPAKDVPAVYALGA